MEEEVGANCDSSQFREKKEEKESGGKERLLGGNLNRVSQGKTGSFKRCIFKGKRSFVYSNPPKTGKPLSP